MNVDKEKPKQRVIREKLVNRIGCYIFLVPIWLGLAIMLFLGSFGMFRLYFAGNQATGIEPYQPYYLLIASIVLLTAIGMAVSIWSRTRYLIENVRNYRILQRENLRIERLLNEKVEISNSTENMLYSEQRDTQYQSKR